MHVQNGDRLPCAIIGDMTSTTRLNKGCRPKVVTPIGRKFSSIDNFFFGGLTPTNSLFVGLAAPISSPIARITNSKGTVGNSSSQSLEQKRKFVKSGN